MYRAYITRIKNLRKHTNADRLLVGECFGNNVIVGLNTQPDELGIYFPIDGKIGIEYAEKNNLLRKKDENGNNIGGYLDPEKRNIRALKMRGEKSDGLFMPLTSLSDFTDIKTLKEGARIDVLNGVVICEKYIPAQNNPRNGKQGNRTRNKSAPISPLFREHADTEQLQYNLSAFRPDDQIEITLKMHGTSQRTGYLPVLKGYRRTLKDRIFKREGTPIYDWGYVSGTRRTVLETFDGGFYGSNAFRETHSKVFEGKLWKGETVYYEVVGFTDNGTPIMASCDNKKVGDKEFTKQYGNTTTFSYGCRPGHLGGLIEDKEIVDNEAIVYPQSDLYVYRMTMTNEDGDVIEYTPDFMRYRCEQMGVKCVPVFYEGYIPQFINPNDIGAYVMTVAEDYYDGADPIGKTHIREGVVVRIVNRPKFAAYKHKNFAFKVLEGIIKESAAAPDMEEAEELKKEA